MPYIYKIENQINGKIYIGKTSRTVEERWNEHIRASRQERFENRPLYKAIRKYGENAFSIDSIEEVASDEIACEREKYWISYYHSYGRTGYNATTGGDGRSWLNHDLIIEKYLELKNAKAVCEYLGVSAKTVSKQLKESGVKMLSTGEILAQRARKRIDMLTSSGEYIKSFSSVHEACEFLLENNKCSSIKTKYKITEACNGKYKTVAGYSWRYSLSEGK